MSRCAYKFTGSCVSKVIGTTDTGVMPQLAGEALSVKATGISLEWCVIDKTALWQFVNNGALFMCRFECECVSIRWHKRKQPLNGAHTTHRP